MKITVEGTPNEMAEWMFALSGRPATQVEGAPVNLTQSMRDRLDAADEAAGDAGTDGELPGCDNCQRFGRDRENCRRANCAYSTVNAAAQLGG